jgi:CheY-like chemotaxis protein
VSRDHALEDRTECVRTLYKQIPNSMAAALGVTAYLVVTLWRHVPHALAGRCVIVIDDEAAIRDGMHELLSQWGCTSLEAATAQQALDLLAAHSAVPELVLADYRLTQGSNGANAVELLRQRFGQGLPALLITGDTGPERLREAKASGLHMLHKPVRPAQLRALCNYLLTRR